MEIKATILAKGAPNRCKDGRTVMCSIAVSESHGLIRLYPISITEHPDLSVWTSAVFHVEKSTKDSRDESYRLTSYSVEGKMTDRYKKRDLLNACVLKSGEVDPIDYQNEACKSIAIVKCFGCLGASLIPREICSDINAGTDEDGFAMTQSEFPFKPYIEWTSIQMKQHRTHLVGQEVYEGMRRNASTPFRIFENLHVGDQDYEHWLVIGNINGRRNVWVCAHAHRQKKIPQLPMLESYLTGDGSQSGWPYLKQEEFNAKPAEAQMQFNFTT